MSFKRFLHKFRHSLRGPFSLAAEHSGTDFIAVLTTDKIFPDDIELSEDEIMQFHEPKEITEKAGALNPYFEGVLIGKGMRVVGEDGG